MNTCFLYQAKPLPKQYLLKYGAKVVGLCVKGVTNV